MSSSADRRGVLNDIASLSETEHTEIYKIVLAHNRRASDEHAKTHVSKNRNGIFFNLATVHESLFLEICEFVDFCKKNKPVLDQYEIELTAISQGKTLPPPPPPPPASAAAAPDDDGGGGPGDPDPPAQRDLKKHWVENLSADVRSQIGAFARSVFAVREKQVARRTSKFHHALKRLSKRAVPAGGGGASATSATSAAAATELLVKEQYLLCDAPVAV